jgi:hypothetical protein
MSIAQNHVWPDRPFVSLTEAVTWIVRGEPLTDDDIVREGLELKRKWANAEGRPHPLLVPLELMLSGAKRDDYAQATSESDPDILDRDRRLWARAEKWVSESGLDLAAAHSIVKEAVAEFDETAARYERCYSRLWQMHAEKRDVVWVYANGSTGRMPLPLECIMSEPWHLRGGGYYGLKGVIVPGQQADLDCPVYTDPVISSKHTLALRRLCGTGPSSKSTGRPAGIGYAAQDIELAREALLWLDRQPLGTSAAGAARSLLDRIPGQGSPENKVKRLVRKIRELQSLPRFP